MFLSFLYESYKWNHVTTYFSLLKKKDLHINIMRNNCIKGVALRDIKAMWTIQNTAAVHGAEITLATVCTGYHLGFWHC